MIWFLYCIAQNEAVQEKLFEEMNGIFGQSDRDCTAEDVAEMKYLDCCVKESMRLYSPIPSVMRSLTDDVQVGKIF